EPSRIAAFWEFRPRAPWDLLAVEQREYFELLGDGLVVVLAPGQRPRPPRGTAICVRLIRARLAAVRFQTPGRIYVSVRRPRGSGWRPMVAREGARVRSSTPP